MWFELQEKNFVKHSENLPQHLPEKFIGDNLSITDIAWRNWDLSIVGIAQSIFEIIGYRYRFSTERFIMPITVDEAAWATNGYFCCRCAILADSEQCAVIAASLLWHEVSAVIAAMLHVMQHEVIAPCDLK